MENAKVVAVLWMLVGVALVVSLFAAKVSIELDKHQWSSVVVPKAHQPGVRYTK